MKRSRMKKPLAKFPRLMRRVKKKSFKSEPKSRRPKYRWIEDLRNIHKGEEIWVLGTGWSLDEFPDDFFEDKIAIAHKAASIAFPYCNYAWVGTHGKGLEKFLKFHGKSGFKKIIIGKRRGRKLPFPPKWLGANSRDPIYMVKESNLRHSRRKEVFKDMVREMARCIMEGRPYRPYVCYGTTLQFSIEAAIIMGASKVTLAGASHRGTKWKLNAQNRGVSFIHHRKPPPEGFFLPQPWEEPCNFGTNVLAETFKPYGISIRRYFYEKGYEQIPRPIESGEEKKIKKSTTPP